MNDALTLEIPIEKKDAKQRGITKNLCRLLLYLNESRDQYHLFAAKLIKLNKPAGEEICIVPYSAFKDFSKLNIQEKDYSYNSQLNCCIVRGCESLITILKEWEAEILIIFYADEQGCTKIISKAKELEPRFWQFSKDGYDIPFIKQIERCELFLFYSMSRAVFEIIGSRIGIMNFYERIKHLF